MEKYNLKVGSIDIAQIEKYAKDLVKVYKSEKEKRNKLQILYRQLMKFADDLKNTVLKLKSAHQSLKESYLDTVHRLVLASEYKDEDTGDHIIRISYYSALIAEKLGMSPTGIQNILYASPMHDVGKIGIPDSILMKPGRLNEEEFEIMKTHTIIGKKLLTDSKAEVLKLAEEIAFSHHEKWNGSGYPRGISRDEIPLAGRIVALADNFDAITSRRPYKPSYPVEVALDIIKKERGEHFDPDIADVFTKNIDAVLRIKKEADINVRHPNGLFCQE